MTVNHRARFMGNNLAETGTMTYSGEQALYPMTNVLNALRSRVGKFAGNFEVKSSNKKLYINDGADKTVTLTEASYAGGAALASHVQTQLNAASSGWTVTYDDDDGGYRFRIAHGAGAVTLRFSQTTDAAWDTLGYTSAVDLTAPLLDAPADEQRNHTSEWLEWDLGLAQEVTFFAAIGRIESAFGLSQSATVRLMANSVDDWSDPPLEVTVTPHDRGLMRFLDDVEDTTYRYWRLEIVDRLNTRGPEGIEVGHLYLGDHITFAATSVQQGAFEKATIDPSEEVEAESGARFFLKRPKYAVLTGMGIALVPESERRAVESLFRKVGRSTPFYFSLDPTLKVTSELQDLTAYVTFGSEPKFSHVFRGYFNISLDLREAV